MVTTEAPAPVRGARPLIAGPRDTRPIQLPRYVTEAVDALRHGGETWEDFFWRVILSPRGYVRVAPPREGNEE